MNDTPNAASSIDPDEVIKGFGQASETTLLFSDALKLFLAFEKNDIQNPYKEIDDEEVMNLCAQPGRLPEHLKSFILWQSNILKLDILEISKTEMPKGFKFKYDVKGSRLAAMGSNEERKAAIQTYMDEQERYFAKFNEVRAILEATEDRFVTIEGMLLRAESMDDAVSSRIQNEKDALEEIKKQLCDIRAVLEDDVLPDVINFDKAPEIAKGVMVRLSEINITLRDNIRKHQVSRDEE